MKTENTWKCLLIISLISKTAQVTIAYSAVWLDFSISLTDDTSFELIGEWKSWTFDLVHWNGRKFKFDIIEILSSSTGCCVKKKGPRKRQKKFKWMSGIVEDENNRIAYILKISYTIQSSNSLNILWTLNLNMFFISFPISNVISLKNSFNFSHWCSQLA